VSDLFRTIAFDPLLPWPWIAAITGLALLAAILGGGLRLRSAIPRSLAALFLALALSGPQRVSEDRTPLPDTTVLLVDESESMTLEDRAETARTLTDALRTTILTDGPMDIVTVPIPPDPDGTRLARALTDALSSVPEGRLAGVIALTDGRSHDVSDATADILPEGVPFHGLIIGNPEARDRRISAITAPRFGVVGEEAQFSLRVDDPGFEGERASIEVRLNGERKARFPITIGQTLDIPLEIERRGRNIVEMTVEAVPGGELTLNNNLFVAEISGIRDRMRVLLITGEPHNGGRAWRNLLKSDPAIDLVQFTILAQPNEKPMRASARELSLIAFPTNQLFEQTLDEFDLIIFDQYERRQMRQRGGRRAPTISPQYFANIARYVEDGGALLLATSPAFAEDDRSLFLTPLVSVLPTRPTGEVTNASFKAELNEKGRLHPITRSFSGREDTQWGPWYRAIDNEPIAGNVLMEGPDGTPLFIIDRVGDGRVAMLMSDQAWLWAKGHAGGGPYREMFRRTAHWLMGEPDLDAETLTARAQNGQLVIERRTLGDVPTTAEVIDPDGRTRRVTLQESAPGLFTATLPLSDGDSAGLGAYRLRHGDISTVAAVGSLNPIEYAELLPTTDVLSPLAEATGGSVRYLGNDLPLIRHVRGRGDLSGANWLGLRDNNVSIVTQSNRQPLAPPLLFFVLFFLSLAWGWWREAR
jgi:uncharacterized membrane protein